MKQDVHNMFFAASVWPLANKSFAIKNSFVIAADLLAHYAFLPLPRLFQNVYFFHHSLPLLQRQATLPPPGQLEYYDVAWGLHKVHLKGKGWLRTVD
jgi:hypothetical protein